MLEILVVDDEQTILTSIGEVLRELHYHVSLAQDGMAAMAMLKNRVYDLLICDIRLPHVDGMSIFRYVRQYAPSTNVVFMTAFVDVSQAVTALHEGATDYLSKPFRLEDLQDRVEKIAKSRELHREIGRATKNREDSQDGDMIVGQSPVLQRALERVEMFSRSDYPVLITGESGTGKELVARLLHSHSKRKDSPLVAVNCAAFPDTLIEAELFGYKRGAFTGAFQDRIGRFKAADQGILLLDEVAEMPLATQAKLLRVLQEGCFEPLGTNQSVKVNVRVISATHRDLLDRMRRGLFREDLYYRLKVLSINLPSLRDRRSDIPMLVGHFLNSFVGETDKLPDISARALAALVAYDYPGNVRELEHAIQHACVLAGGECIDIMHLPPEIAGLSVDAMSQEGSVGVATLPEAMNLFESEYLVKALRKSGGRRTAAAHMLGISRKNLWQKLRRYGLLEATFEDEEIDREREH